MTVRFSMRLLAVRPTPSAVAETQDAVSLSLPVSRNPGGRAMEYGLSIEVCSCRLRGCGCARAFDRSAKDSMRVVSILICILRVRERLGSQATVTPTCIWSSIGARPKAEAQTWPKAAPASASLRTKAQGRQQTTPKQPSPDQPPLHGKILE